MCKLVLGWKCQYHSPIYSSNANANVDDIRCSNKGNV